ncbi:D-alanyl-D-alanine carboxypeptidase/D-alanyl-D-alanine endopeptidase [Gordonia sp. DT219]|uniref:D-alanyl-D-alanine carboxypeptidase/D-alanyl-D-alanine endopeptidase n=1 Tax=Gordonia sp. DT219 TaxID=3416658 RepID=UPI003CEA5B89
MGAHHGNAPVKRPGTRRRRLIWSLISVILVAAIAVGGVFTYRQLTEPDPLPPGTPGRPAPIAFTPVINPVSANAPEPTAPGITKAIVQSLKSPALGTLTGQISDSLTGTVLWSQGAERPRTPASNAKILTASAVLLALPHDQRLTTSVLAGPGGQVILKGAGDPTLTAQPPGVESFYTDPGRISALADQIKRAGIDPTSVAVDLSAYSGPTMDPTWSRGDIAGGDIAPMESLMVDGARIKPLDEYSPRVDDPGVTAGQALARALGVSTDVTEQTAPAGARTVAQVTSAPLVTRVDDMMRFSDNVEAEALSIELARSQGEPATLAGGAQAVLKVLNANGFPTAGAKLQDSSGLSYGNLVPASLLDTLMGAASGPIGSDSPAQAHAAKMRPMLDGLPIAGGTGTLADRFDARTNPGAGWVRAKTGTLTGVSSLTGIVQTVDGRVLSFALMSGGTSPADARPALDAIPGDLRECGCR